MVYAITSFCSKPAHDQVCSPKKAALAFDILMAASLVTVVVLTILAHSGIPLGHLKGIGVIGYGALGFGGFALLIFVVDVLAACRSREKMLKNTPEKQIHQIQPEKPLSTIDPVDTLMKFLFLDLINSDNLAKVQPLGNLLDSINIFLEEFNNEHDLHLQAIGSFHSSSSKDPWQTIKIIDKDVVKEGEVSGFLKQMNDLLYETYGVIGNGGDSCRVVGGQQKRTPQSFIKAKVFMYPQIQISLIDIRRILGITSQELYIQELKNAY